MPHRQFVDDTGATWAVWDVRPAAAGQVLARIPAPARPVRGPIPDLDRALADGWLCFESSAEKRRLAPIPTGWDSLSAADLAKLCESAPGVRRRRAANGG